MSQLEKIFAAIANRYNPDMMPGFTTVVQFELGEEAYFLTIADGKCDYGSGRVDNPEATIGMDPGEFEAMVKGELNPMMAFMQGKIKVDGNMGTVMKLQSMLAG